MRTSNECYIKEQCKKYVDGNCTQNKFCIKLFKLDYMFDSAQMSDFQRKHIPLYYDKDKTDYDKFVTLKQIQDNIEKFVRGGHNLFIYSSNCGNGKTSWANRLVQAYFNRIWYKCNMDCKALFINVPRFFLALKDNISEKSDYIEHIKANILIADLVVWDEIGVKLLTNFEHENLLSMLNARLDMNKSNIYTSNISGETLQEKLGDRLYSRIVNNSCVVELQGKDKRGQY